MQYINYNGKLFKEDDAIISAKNRGLRYGDGLFETMKIKNGTIVLSNEHFERLWIGMKQMQFEIPKLLTAEKLKKEIFELAQKNNLNNARLRLTVIRGDGGLYDAKNNFPNYIIEAMPLLNENGAFNSNGLSLCIYEDAKKSIDAFSNLKTNNYLPYLMGALFAKQQKCNDAIIMNSNANISDTTIANIFYIKNKIIYTPSLSEGCVAGVFRQWLLMALTTIGFSMKETVVTKNDLLEADEIFLSNSIYNIRWVVNVENATYSNSITNGIVTNLQNKFPSIYC